ncbi:MAG: S9 family peptidase [Xanthomonadales bacterium]|nr:S9 family peptidase [Xanthomonadales bacterium]
MISPHAIRPCAALVFACVAAGASAAPVFEPMDVFALQWADNPRLSPDGRRIVYERNGFDVMKDRRRTSLWTIDADGRRHRPLAANGRAAAWSPDGQRIAFVATVDGATQIHVHWNDSGETARISELTQAPDGLAWSPDGRWIAFTMRVPASSPSFATMPTPPKGAEWAAAPKLIDRVLYRFDGGGYVDPGYTHLFVVAADGGSARALTNGPFNVDGDFAWTRDGKALIVSANMATDWEYQPADTELYRVDLAGAEPLRLTTRKGPDRSPRVSPDGKRLAWLGYDDDGRPQQPAHVHVAALDARQPRVLAADVDHDITDAQWDGDRGLWLQFDERGRSRIGWIDAGGGAIHAVADDVGGTAMGRPYTSGGFSAAGGRVAYTRGTEYRPADVAVVERRGKPRVLTDLGANLLDHRELGRISEITVPSSADGRPIQAWIVTPPGFEPAKKYPLLLEIHGGPFAAYGPHFAPELQLYAAQGYIVVYANPRGSTSYGSEFANLIRDAYPGRDYDDLMSVVDAAIARGSVDADNLFVTGGSGGGALTAWIVGHTDRFRAAVSAKPVINWYSFVLTSDFYPVFSRYWFPGNPWEKTEHYMQRSPIQFVGNVRTPTMLLVGDDDHRTPASEAEQFYQALKLRRIDTAMVRIPGASHSINARPSNLIAQVAYTIAWFEKHRAKPAP